MSASKSQSSFWWLWISVALILIGFAVRAHAIDALPPFNDESHHIRRAEEVYTFTNRDLNLTLGKLLSYYWIGIFGADRLDAIFVGRTSTALFSLLGLAGTFITARLLFGRWAGLLALFLATFSPFMIFFDRLALTDALTAAVAIVLIGASLRLMRRDHNHWGDRWAIFVGMLCGLVVMAKLLGLPMIAVPLLAVVLFGNIPVPSPWQHRDIGNWLRGIWRTYRPMLGTVYITFGLTMLPFLWHIFDRVAISRQHLPIVNNNLINGAAADRSPIEIFVDNVEMLWETHWLLHGYILWPVMLLTFAYVIWRRDRIGLFLVGCIGLAWSLSILVAAELSTRYLTLGVLPSLVLVSGGATALVNAVQHRRATIGMIASLVIVWMITSVAFIYNAWTDPTELNLPDRDRWEYYENFSAGYGLIDAAADIEKLPRSEPSGRVNVLGLVGSCHQLRLYLDEDGPVWLECPFFGWQGEFMPEVVETVNQRLQEESIVYLLVEPELRFTDLSMLNVEWELIKRYPRPFNGMTVELYRVYPAEGDGVSRLCTASGAICCSGGDSSCQKSG